MLSQIEKHIIVVCMPQPGPRFNDSKECRSLEWIQSIQNRKMFVDVD